MFSIPGLLRSGSKLSWPYRRLRPRSGLRCCSGCSLVCKAKITAAAASHAYLCGIQALAHMQLMPGLTDLCSWLDEQRIPRCLAMQNLFS